MSYVWSKFLDEFDSSAWGSRGGTTTYQSSYDVGANYGPSNFDTRNAFKGTASYVLPFGHGGMFFNKNNIVDEFIGGWQLSSNFVLQSGNPFTVTVPSSIASSYAGSGNLLSELHRQRSPAERAAEPLPLVQPKHSPTT